MAAFVCRNESDSQGVIVHYVKSRDVVQVSMWYDHCVGSETQEIPLALFLGMIGVDAKRIKKLLK